MSDTYDDITAKHYAAFRPSLHAPILSKCIQANNYFNKGLDIGCGTGRSTLALRKYCNSVIGIDPSREMLDNAIQESQTTYLRGSLEELELKNDSFDIITFAGALHYAKSQKLLDHVQRVGEKGAKIIVYDFEVLLNDALDILSIVLKKEKSDYNYEANFSGLRTKEIIPVETVKEKINLSVSTSDLTHLVLSEKRLYEQLKIRWGQRDVFKNTQSLLHDTSNGKNYPLEANIFYSTYENEKNQ